LLREVGQGNAGGGRARGAPLPGPRRGVPCARPSRAVPSAGATQREPLHRGAPGGHALPWLRLSPPQRFAVGPTGTDGLFDIRVQAGVFEVHRGRIVFHLFAGAQGDGAKDDGLIRRTQKARWCSGPVGEVGTGPSTFAEASADRLRRPRLPPHAYSTAARPAVTPYPLNPMIAPTRRNGDD
jgi:hypothetical protein